MSHNGTISNVVALRSSDWFSAVSSALARFGPVCSLAQLSLLCSPLHARHVFPLLSILSLLLLLLPLPLPAAAAAAAAAAGGAAAAAAGAGAAAAAAAAAGTAAAGFGANADTQRQCLFHKTALVDQWRSPGVRLHLMCCYQCFRTCAFLECKLQFPGHWRTQNIFFSRSRTSTHQTAS